MDLDSFRNLLTNSGQETLRAASALEPGEVDFLRHYDLLCRTYPTDLARAALETAILRTEARTKFPHADRMYFTRPGLEQATSSDVAAYRTGRFHDFNRVLDLGCSIGGDALALAQHAPVVGIDIDPLRLAMAQVNAANLGLSGRVVLLQADLIQGIPLKLAPDVAFFYDPARRDERGRVYSVEGYSPPLSVVNGWLRHFPAGGVKVSPGVDLDELVDYDPEVEFISLNGDLKEAVLWFGPLKKTWRRATLLPGEYTMARGEDDSPIPPRLSDPKQFLYEPDPAILRAGLVRDLGLTLDACQLDAEIAYLTADALIPTPFARAWEIEAWFPFSLKRLRKELRVRNVGEVAVKKRGSPLEPEALIRDLRLKGGEFRWVFLTQLNGKPVVVLAKKEIVSEPADEE